MKSFYETLKRIYKNNLSDRDTIYNCFDKEYKQFIKDLDKCNIEIINSNNIQDSNYNDIYIIYIYNENNEGEYIIDYFYPYSLNKKRSEKIEEVRIARIDFKSLVILSKYKNGLSIDKNILSKLNKYRYDKKASRYKYEVKKASLYNLNNFIRENFNHMIEKYQMDNYNGICFTKAIRINKINLLSDLKSTIVTI